jgi:ABC-type bacteriocin/lantibiotic exporter with double-glycine peptidase domain
LSANAGAVAGSSGSAFASANVRRASTTIWEGLVFLIVSAKPLAQFRQASASRKAMNMLRFAITSPLLNLLVRFAEERHGDELRKCSNDKLHDQLRSTSRSLTIDAVIAVSMIAIFMVMGAVSLHVTIVFMIMFVPPLLIYLWFCTVDRYVLRELLREIITAREHDITEK